jgi:hypothetical protein
MNEISPRLTGNDVFRFKWEWLDKMADTDPVCSRFKQANMPAIPGMRVIVFMWPDDSFAKLTTNWSGDKPPPLDEAGIEQAYRIGRAHLERVWEEEGGV